MGLEVDDVFYFKHKPNKVWKVEYHRDSGIYVHCVCIKSDDPKAVGDTMHTDQCVPGFENDIVYLGNYSAYLKETQPNTKLHVAQALPPLPPPSPSQLKIRELETMLDKYKRAYKALRRVLQRQLVTHKFYVSTTTMEFNDAADLIAEIDNSNKDAES